MNRGKDLKSARKKVVRQKICQMMKHTPKTTRYISQPFISGGDYLTTQTVVRSICALFVGLSLLFVALSVIRWPASC
jgi:hypothetical protein